MNGRTEIVVFCVLIYIPLDQRTPVDILKMAFSFVVHAVVRYMFIKYFLSLWCKYFVPRKFDRSLESFCCILFPLPLSNSSETKRIHFEPNQTFNSTKYFIIIVIIKLLKRSPENKLINELCYRWQMYFDFVTNHIARSDADCHTSFCTHQ